MSEETLRKQVERAARADALLKNELLNEVFEVCEKELIGEFIDTYPEDKERRDDAWRCIRILRNIRGKLKKIIIDGKTSADDLLRVKPTTVERITDKVRKIV
jgi:hypothetical protein